MLPGAHVLHEADARQKESAGSISGAELAPSADFHELFNRFAKPILSYIFARLGDISLAEELTQETFVRAFRKAGSKSAESQFSTWLFGIAHNVVREAIKERYRTRRQESLDESSSSKYPDLRLRPDDCLITGEMQRIIHRALASLPEHYQAVFVLKIINRLRYEQISAVTGLSIGKLKTDLHRARSEMRKRLLPYIGRREPGTGGGA